MTIPTQVASHQNMYTYVGTCVRRNTCLRHPGRTGMVLGTVGTCRDAHLRQGQLQSNEIWVTQNLTGVHSRKPTHKPRWLVRSSLHPLCRFFFLLRRYQQVILFSSPFHLLIFIARPLSIHQNIAFGWGIIIVTASASMPNTSAMLIAF
jgi:hypothetical protein